MPGCDSPSLIKWTAGHVRIVASTESDRRCLWHINQTSAASQVSALKLGRLATGSSSFWVFFTCPGTSRFWVLKRGPGILASLGQRAEGYAARLNPPPNQIEQHMLTNSRSVDEYTAPVADPDLPPQRSRWLRELRTQNKRNVNHSVVIISHTVVLWIVRNS